MTALKDAFRRAFDLNVALHLATGLRSKWVRWPMSPTGEDLDLSPVRFKVEGDLHVAYLDLAASPTTMWRELRDQVVADTVAAVRAEKNLKFFGREHGVDYSVLWRAKSGRTVPDSVVALMGKVPQIVLRGPLGESYEGAVTLTTADLGALMVGL